MTLQELQDQRALVYAAYTKALQSQEYQVGQGSTARRTRRADFEQLRLELERLDAKIATATAAANGTRRIYNIVPRRC